MDAAYRFGFLYRLERAEKRDTDRANRTVHVKEYRRKDGTLVRSHLRRRPAKDAQRDKCIRSKPKATTPPSTEPSSALERRLHQHGKPALYCQRLQRASLGNTGAKPSAVALDDELGCQIHPTPDREWAEAAVAKAIAVWSDMTASTARKEAEQAADCSPLGPQQSCPASVIAFDSDQATAECGQRKKDAAAAAKTAKKSAKKDAAAAARTAKKSAKREVAAAATTPRLRYLGGSAHYQVSSNPTGPTKKDGTPDMRYAANRETFLSPRASSC